MRMPECLLHTFTVNCQLSKTLITHGEEHATDDYTNIPASIMRRVHPSPQLPYAQYQPLALLRAEIERLMGAKYTPIRAPSPVVSTAVNFEELGFPKDHPGRQPTDTYYVNRTTCLRTHTSAHEVQTFRDGNMRWLLTADVFRRDEIDSSHYPVFHQMEGASAFDRADYAPGGLVEQEIEAMESRLAEMRIEITDNVDLTEAGNWQPHHARDAPHQAALALRHLKATLNTLVHGLFQPRLAMEGSAIEPLKVRWIPAFFPFTSPSFEVEVWFRGKWLEILGTGIVQQRTFDKAGIPDKLGWAFGLGLERIAMVLFSIPDIRLFWSEDPRFVSQFKVPPTDGRAAPLVTFKPYSKYPSCYKDISFWVPPSFHENDLFETVRDHAGDLVEDVACIDDFVHPKTKRRSKCYRVNYQSMDANLENEQVNALHATRQVLFLHKVTFPVWPNFQEPHEHGLARFQARNVQLTTSDDVRIGMWHHLPNELYKEEAAKHGKGFDALPDDFQLPDQVFERALREYPTYVYLHGNALNRAAPFRVLSYQELSEAQNANVVAIDYRGFGDSESFPTEHGVVNDAYAAVEYVRQHSINQTTGNRQGLALVGQSLGTGIAVQCALRMYRQGEFLDALVLLAPFRALRPMVSEFRMAGLAPIFGWLDYFPYKEKLLDLVHFKFDSEVALLEILDGNVRKGPTTPPTIVLVHAQDDDVIPVQQSDELLRSAENALGTMKKASSFHVWASTLPDIGTAHAILRRSARLPEHLPRC
ncbi:hypothetical protein MVES_000532 [Malassezia vespertilionis]|uniref:phenylalanine--tRNA ligase n=1 Tax=Malassezia vespertilionis TaxID=2020962 RepID=A0A2N1JGV9_9BASI|nr:hypothetical protein MVES_000532 [Malassezia vespertilionis]